MEQSGESLTSLMIVVTLAFLVPVILYKFRIKVLPVVVAEILAGLIIGKSGFNLVGSDRWLESISLFGFIFLMFLSGLEIDFSSLSRRGSKKGTAYNPLMISSVIFLGILAVSYLLSLSLVAMHLASRPFFMMLIIATVSLGIVVPVLKEKKIIDTPMGQTLLLITVLADFFTMILLAFYIGLQAENVSSMGLLLLFFVVVVLIYFFIRRFASGKTFLNLSQSTVQIGTRATFALILLFVVLSDSMGADSILGAFLAGVVVSLLAPKKEFVRQLDSFGYGFLIPIFFVMVGAKMELWSLFTNWKIVLLIPVLLVSVFVSKMIPVLILKKWFDWRHVTSAGVLLSAKLSLVIAASTIALNMKIIGEDLHGALILVAVLSSLIFPILFSKIFPETKEKIPLLTIIGANHISMPVAADLQKEGYEVHLYTANFSNDDPVNVENEKKYTLHHVKDLQTQTLVEAGAFQTDGIVFATMDDQVNIDLAYFAESEGIKNMVVRAEDPQKHDILQRYGYRVFSTLYASRTLLKALIEHPSAVRLITQNDDSIREVTVNNPSYHQVALRQLPILGDVLIMRIYRGESFIVPHGNTDIQIGDRLLVSGNPEDILNLKQKLE